MYSLDSSNGTENVCVYLINSRMFRFWVILRWGWIKLAILMIGGEEGKIIIFNIICDL